MATKKTTKKTAKKESSGTELYSIYGARMSKSGERVNISILSGKDDEVKWGCISINPEKAKTVKVTVKDYEVILKIPRVDLEDEEEEEEE